MANRSLKVLTLFVGLASPGVCLGQELASQVFAVATDAPEVSGEASESESEVKVEVEAPGAASQPADGAARTPEETSRKPWRADFNSDIYYRNKVEFSIESGMLPINLPFVFDVFVGGNYSQNPLHYTAVPVFPSVRWQMGDLHGPWFLRGNTDMTFTWSVTGFPRGPEKLYDAFDLGFRRNFVQRNWRVAPYFEVRIGAGMIDAQEPYGNDYAQGQDLTFTLMVGSGFRYNFNSRYSMAIGATYFHVSNAYLSEPKYDDNGINVCGPLLGFNVRLSRPKE
jgi:hypothetical protein